MADDEVKPLDPEVEQVRRRMMRLMIVSILIMVVGLIAVFAGVVYKLNNEPDQGDESIRVASGGQSGATSLALNASLTVDIPEGAMVIDKKLDGNVLLIDLRLDDGSRQFIVVDLAKGQIATRLSFD